MAGKFFPVICCHFREHHIVLNSSLVRVEDPPLLLPVLVRSALGHYPIMAVIKVEVMKLIAWFQRLDDRTWGVEFKVPFLPLIDQHSYEMSMRVASILLGAPGVKGYTRCEGV